MIVRIVRMTLIKEEVETFKKYFSESYLQIRNFEGCTHLELYEDVADSSIICTYSHWIDESYLNNYRSSDLFKSTWSKVKPLFNAAPIAFSLKTTNY